MYQNHLLFVPSLMTKNDEIRYTVEVENVGDISNHEYIGIQTNEALTKFIMDYLAREREVLDKIIMLCTKEVRENRLPFIDNKTTLEHYKQSIIHFIQERREISEEEINALFEVVDYIPQNNENENQIITALERIIAPKEISERRKRVYVDFTGGIRSAALTLVFASRILDKEGVEVDKILYSYLPNKEEKGFGIIEECTRTYRIFAEFEENIKLQNNIIDQTSEYRDKSEAEIRARNKLKEMQEASRLNQSQNLKEGEKVLKSILGEIDQTNMSHMQKKNLEQIGKQQEYMSRGLEDSIFSIKHHLESGNYDKALTTFREKIVKALLDARIIKVSNFYLENGKLRRDVPENEIAAAYGYYTGSSEHTFLGAVKEYIRLLAEHPEKAPKEIKEKYFGEVFFDMNTYVKNIPKGGYAHNSYSRRMCDDAIIPYIERYYNKSKNMREAIRRYTEFDNLYMGYGFPFACTYGRKYYFDGYAKKYSDSFENGVNSLQGFYENKCNKKMERILNSFSEEKFDYSTLIQAMNDGEYEKLVRMMFPFQLCTGNIMCDAMNYQSWSEFMFEFAKAFCTIKAVRNKVIHPEDMKDRQIKEAFQQMDYILGKIEALRDEIQRKDEKEDDR